VQLAVARRHSVGLSNARRARPGRGLDVAHGCGLRGGVCRRCVMVAHQLQEFDDSPGFDEENSNARQH
jgi:hypothetical protein